MLNDIFSVNQNFLAKFEFERKKMQSSLENFGSFDFKPSFDILLSQNKQNKYTETILILKNEKNLMSIIFI